MWFQLVPALGDGLVTQIPAVIISIASALLLARGGTSGATDIAIGEQLGRYPSALATVGVLMGFFALVPGLPFVPFILGAGILLGFAWHAYSKKKQKEEAALLTLPEPERAVEKSMGDILDLDEIHVEFSPDLVAMALDPATGLDARIKNMRNHVATTFGLVLPEIRLTDNASLPNGAYRIRIHGVEQARDQLRPDHFLALLGDTDPLILPGEAVNEPVYGAPAKWLTQDQQETAVMQGCTVVTPTEILATHLLETIKNNLARLLSLRAMRRLLDEFTNLSDGSKNDSNRRLLDDLIPDKISMDTLLQVLKLLLEEKVSIRNLPLILEAIAEGRSTFASAEGLCEHTRQRLGFQLVSGLKREDGSLPLVQLAPEWETLFLEYQIEASPGVADVALPPDEFNRLAKSVSEKLNKANESGFFPAIVTSVKRRRFLQAILSAKGIVAPVLSFEEIAKDAKPSIVGLVPG